MSSRYFAFHSTQPKKKQQQHRLHWLRSCAAIAGRLARALSQLRTARSIVRLRVWKFEFLIISRNYEIYNDWRQDRVIRRSFWFISFDFKRFIWPVEVEACFQVEKVAKVYYTLAKQILKVFASILNQQLFLFILFTMCYYNPRPFFHIHRQIPFEYQANPSHVTVSRDDPATGRAAGAGAAWQHGECQLPGEYVPQWAVSEWD